jgi:hypothetical protein
LLRLRGEGLGHGNAKFLWLGLGFLLLSGIISLWGSIAYSDVRREIPVSPASSGKVFLFTAKKLGVPILKASIEIDNGSAEKGRPLYQVQARVDSLHSLGFLFRMNNRFTSTVELETCSPVRYIKEINQGGFLIEDKNYLQAFTFDFSNKKVILEKTEKKEGQEIPITADTYDPLSMFMRCYLKEELRPGQDLWMSIYDGVKLRHMVFHSKKERIRSKMFGEVEAVCLGSTTSFSAFGDREGIIRIWYAADGKKTPLAMELNLPTGDLKFELVDIKENKERGE